MFEGLAVAENHPGVQWVAPAWREVEEEFTTQAIYLAASSTQALVDPGAGSDLIGIDALDRETDALAEQGLRFVAMPD